MNDEWATMETAPKSTSVASQFGHDVTGVYLELYCPNMVGPKSDPMMGICIGWWEPHLRGGCWMGEGDFPLNPSHWRHLRPAPQDAERRGLMLWFLFFRPARRAIGLGVLFVILFILWSALR